MDNEAVLSSLCQHIIALTYEYTDLKTGQPRLNHISGFVMSIRDQWFFVTAGHVLDDIHKAIQAGYPPRNWQIYDGMGTEATYKRSYPFDFQNTPNAYWRDDEKGIDYALILLRPFYRDLIQKNNVKPITEQAWQEGLPSVFDAFYLLGVPEETTQVLDEGSRRRIQAAYYLLRAEPTNNPPECLKKPFPRFYGKIASATQGAPESIVGMSGGPIFGFVEDENGAARYWVVAIQSGWSKPDRVIAACPIKVFGSAISAQLAEIEVSGKVENEEQS